MAAAVEFHSAVLANGLPVIEIPMPGRLSTAIAVAFPGGARHEGPGEIGVAHFLEHMAFKGAKKHRTARILNRSAEHLGADLNGVTTDDYVEFNAVVRAESVMPTLDLLTDISGQALLEESHLETDRAVILQEIADDDEDPATAADRRLLKALFGGHRLATSTAGEAHHVARLTHGQLVSFRRDHWSPEGGVAVIGGNLTSLDRELLTQLLNRIPARPPPPSPAPVPPFKRWVEVQERDGDIAHLRLAYAVQGLDLGRPSDRATGAVYSDVLGGLAGSRLVEELREERGLCYAIDSYVWGYPEAALLTVECSLRATNIAEAYERIDTIISELSEHGPTEEEALRGRSYATGACALEFESNTARVDYAIELVMQYGDQGVDPLTHLRDLESVTRDDIAELAASVLPGPCVGCVGEVSAATFD